MSMVAPQQRIASAYVVLQGRYGDVSQYAQQRGVLWPDGLRWWEVLRLTPEQLRNKLSTARPAA